MLSSPKHYSPQTETLPCQEAYNKSLPVCCFGSVRNPLALYCQVQIFIQDLGISHTVDLKICMDHCDVGQNTAYHLITISPYSGLWGHKVCLESV